MSGLPFWDLDFRFRGLGLRDSGSEFGDSFGFGG